MNEPKIYGPHDESAVAALREWVEMTLAGKVYIDFQQEMFFLRRKEIFSRMSWIGVKALGAKGMTFSYKNDHVSWRLPCLRCKGEGEVSFKGAIENQYTSAGNKDCFFCGRNGFHVLPSPDRVCAAILVMAMQTMNERQDVTRPQRESLHAFLRIQMEYAEEVFGDEFSHDRCWETRILDFCFHLFYACYEDFDSSSIREEYLKVWELAEAAYGRFLENDRKVKEFFSELDECFPIADSE